MYKLTQTDGTGDERRLKGKTNGLGYGEYKNDHFEWIRLFKSN